MADNNGGPWGGGNRGGGRPPANGNGGNGGQPPGGNRPPQNDFDDLVQKGRDQFRVLMGGNGGSNGSGAPRGGVSGGGSKTLIWGALGLAVVGWLFASFYSVRPEERSIELMFGRYYDTGEPGLNFAPWPVVTHEVEPYTTERIIEIGTSRSGQDAGLMLTGDENIVDIDFQVVWNINDLQSYLFNLADPEATIDAVAESAMREIIAQSELAPILNRDRGVIADRLKDLIQRTLDSYESGVNIVRVNFDKADPPEPVIASFRAVQDAEQRRDQLQNEADAYFNSKVGQARGDAAQILEQAEGYRARVVNEAQGEAARFESVLAEYQNAPDVTRKRIYLETMEKVLGGSDLILMDSQNGQQSAVPYLSLNELRRNSTSQSSSQNTGGSN